MYHFFLFFSFCYYYYYYSRKWCRIVLIKRETHLYFMLRHRLGPAQVGRPAGPLFIAMMSSNIPDPSSDLLCLYTFLYIYCCQCMERKEWPPSPFIFTNIWLILARYLRKSTPSYLSHCWVLTNTFVSRHHPMYSNGIPAG